MFRRKFQRRRRRPAPPRKVQLEKLEPRQLLAADSIGVTPLDTGEFLLGTVAVTPVFFESNGQIDTESQNWSAAEIDEVLTKVAAGVNWWSDTLDTLNTVHSLDFIVDDSFAKTPFETGYEPIDRSSSAFNLYVGDFVTAQGFGDANSIEDAVKQFNERQRLAHGTDWAFTIFVVDSSEDADGLFAGGPGFSAAFAFAGGLFFVSPSTRPTSTFTHEMGHIFWARDEYPGGGSWSDTRGYYNTQNWNASDNPTPGFQQEISIMRGGVPLTAAFDAHVSPASTLAMVGWQDSDNDGVFDLADVPLDLEAVGHFDHDTSMYHFTGNASAVPLMNRNSSGTQSDITFNQVSHLQYSVDNEPWVSALEPNSQEVDFDIAFPLNASFTSIRLRAIDVSTGITSEVIQGDALTPAITSASVSGIAFVDQNSDEQRDASEIGLATTSIVVRQADGSPLFGGEVQAADFSAGELPSVPNVTLAADGVVTDPKVGVSALQDELRVFQSFDLQRKKWIDLWSSKAALTATFDQSVGKVELSVAGRGQASYARLEAYDASGQLIARVTSDALNEDERETLELTDAQARIASIRAFGHAETAVAISGIRFGFPDSFVTDASGALKFEALPDGNYLVDLVPELVIHEFADSRVPIQVTAGTSEWLAAAAQRVDSPRHNTVSAEDVSGNQEVTAQDALLVINDMGRFGARNLQPTETSGFKVDVNNDGRVSALDALLVINFLGRTKLEFESFSVPEQKIPLQSPPSAQMLNYAGDAVDVARSAADNADTLDQAFVGDTGGQTLASKISHFVGFSALKSIQIPSAEDFVPEQADTLDQRFEEIQVEISEPFQNSLV